MVRNKVRKLKGSDFRRRYNKQWETNDKLKHWLTSREVDSHEMAWCTICRKALHPRIDGLTYHATLHPIESDGEPEAEPDIATISNIQKDVIKLSLALSALVVARNRTFLLLNYLVSFLTKFIHDSDIMKKISINRSKSTEIVKNILKPAQIARIKSILKSQRFSVIIDESTDVTTTHSFCIIVRYYDYSSQCVRKSLWDMVEIYVNEESLASAEQIFEKFINSFESEDVPVTNMLSFCSDTCNLMLGQFESVSTKLRQKILGIQIIKCNSHMEHLSARAAMKSLPAAIEKFVTDVYNYISKSAKRMKRWHLSQKKSRVKALNVLHPNPTRWLSLSQSVARLMKRWEHLRNFLSHEKDAKAEALLNEMSSQMKIYMAFLNFVLPFFTKANRLMQSVKPIIWKKSSPMNELVKKLLICYKNREYVREHNLMSIDPISDFQTRPLNKILVGRDAHRYLIQER